MRGDTGMAARMAARMAGLGAAAALLAMAAACGGDVAGGGLGDAVGADTAGDTAPGPDTAGAGDTDAGGPADAEVATDPGPDPDPGGPGPDTDGGGPPDGGDAGPICLEFEAPCAANTDCCSGYCIDGPDGRLCTRTCDTCPDGYDCNGVTLGGGGDVTFICVPRHRRLCRPCEGHADCEDALSSDVVLCLPASDPAEGSFCGSSCAGGAGCPEGFVCETVALDGGGEAKQCVPLEGLCECKPGWADLDLTTTCLITNGVGTCEGTRTCGAEGLTACEGTPAAPETCNGLDDDCNGTTDDIPAKACTFQNEFGTCEGVEACGPGGAKTCTAAGASAETCNGLDDDCDGVTDEGACDDGLACTADTCDPATGCDHALAPGFCLIAGACVAEGAANPADPCEKCLPAVSTNGWSDAEGQACEDGNPCTANDKCLGGTCSGQAYSCNDGLACTGDVCNGKGGCEHPLVPNTCLIGGACRDILADNPDNPCLVCNPATPTAWSPKAAGTTCDDGNACTYADQCNGTGACQGTFAGCNDGLPCTKDVCDGKGGCTFVPEDACVIAGQCRAAGQANPADSCQTCDPSYSTTLWSPATGGACDDGNPCTFADQCVNGLCKGAAAPCNDFKACTQDVCNGDGTCSYPVLPGSCLINGTCRTDGDANPQNPCQICLSGADPKGWWNADGVTCDDANACTSGDVCSGGACTGQPKLDDYEPNSTFAQAKTLSSKKDCGSWPDNSSSTTASVYPDADVDYFKFAISDEGIWPAGCSFGESAAIWPRVEVSNVPPGLDVELCVTFLCSDGDRDFDCETGDTNNLADMGKSCCSNAAGSAGETVEIDPTCSTLGAGDDGGTVIIRVRRTSGAGSCSPYTLRWGDD